MRFRRRFHTRRFARRVFRRRRSYGGVRRIGYRM